MSRAATPHAPERRLRRDAEKNRGQLLRAAAQVFDAHGLDAGVEEIAKLAGVGVGTLYRRFPTKDALIEALVADLLDTMSRLAKEAATHSEGSGLETFLVAASAHQAEHLGCLPRLWNTDPHNPTLRQVRRQIAGLLADAQHHGRVRPEVTGTDLTMVLWSIRGVIETTRGAAPDAWRRHLELLIAGLRPGQPALRHRALTSSQVDRVIAGES